jgi:cell division control protein 6
MVFDINQFFHDYLESPKIFINHDVLRPEFIPNQLPHRDLQLRQIAAIVANTLKNSTPSNIFLFGKTGTGKTAVIRHVNQQLNYQCGCNGIKEPVWIYLNCQQVNTGYRVLAKISQILDPQDSVPISGWPLDVVFDKVITKLDKVVSSSICFLVLDEIDILVNNCSRNNDGILYNLVRLNERLHLAHINIIGISNVLNFKNQLDPRVLSSLGEEEIIFPAYDATELRDILQQRAELAFAPNVLDNEVIPLCAALAAKEHGDARKALDLLRKAGELAERRSSPKVTEEYVILAQDDMERDKMKEYIDSLPEQLKVILLSIYLMQKSKPNIEIITGDIYNCYLEIQSLIPGLNQLTQRRVSELIRELDLSGIINARTISKGKYGRTKFIRMNITIEDAYKYLKSDHQLSELLEYRPRCLTMSRIQNIVYHQIIR